MHQRRLVAPGLSTCSFFPVPYAIALNEHRMKKGKIERGVVSQKKRVDFPWRALAFFRDRKYLGSISFYIYFFFFFFSYWWLVPEAFSNRLIVHTYHSLSFTPLNFNRRYFFELISPWLPLGNDSLSWNRRSNPPRIASGCISFQFGFRRRSGERRKERTRSIIFFITAKIKFYHYISAKLIKSIDINI